jgi:hypothetical protein
MDGEALVKAGGVPEISAAGRLTRRSMVFVQNAQRNALMKRRIAQDL